MCDIWNTIKCAFHLATHMDWLLFNRSSKASVKNTDPYRRTLWKFYWFIALVICGLESGVFFFFVSEKCRLTRHSRSRKQGRLGHVIGTRETSRGRSLIHFIWFLTTWITVKNSNKCVFVLISMLGRLKNSHSSSCCMIEIKVDKSCKSKFCLNDAKSIPNLHGLHG